MEYISITYLIFVTLMSAVAASGERLKSTRFLSNPFGLLGYDTCQTSLDGRNVSGICYNEVECLLKGGLFSGYCGPPAVEGICCVLSTSKCDKRITDKVAYFTNKGFPRNDLEPFQCQLHIKPLDHMCWARFDFEVFELSSDGSGGTCVYESMGILDSPDGPGGRICGRKTGYATITKLPKGRDLRLSVVVQGPSYRWNIKISQIKCDEEDEIPTYDQCGLANIDERDFQRAKSSKVVKLRKKKTRSVADIPTVTKKRMRSEVFFPSFSARKTFCKSRFDVQPKESHFRLDRTNLKLIDGAETAINEYPWMVSMQLSGAHFCGGSIVSDMWIITAAHCVEFGNIPDFLERLVISVSDHDLTTEKETQSFYRKASQVVFHPMWHNIAGSSGDIALIKLEEPLSFSITVKPACLPINMKLAIFREVGTTIGWGATDSGVTSDYLRKVQLNIIDNITCYENFKSVDVEIRGDMLCTFQGPRGDENVCTGDSGSPLMIEHGGKFVQVGLTSFSMVDCKAPFPAVFTSIAYYLEWIRVALTAIP